jgi:hypothetical protein
MLYTNGYSTSTKIKSRGGRLNALGHFSRQAFSIKEKPNMLVSWPYVLKCWYPQTPLDNG